MTTENKLRIINNIKVVFQVLFLMAVVGYMNAVNMKLEKLQDEINQLRKDTGIIIAK